MAQHRKEELTRIENAVRDWWLEQTVVEIDATVPKAAEYGSRDLTEMGHAVSSFLGRTMNDEEATEFGIYWYALGKMARWTAALREGRRVSDDTLLDLGVYVKMAQRNRAVGGWPSGPEEA